MAVDIDDKKLDGKGLSDLWGIIKQYVAQHGSGVVPATEDILGGIMVGSTLSITNAGVLNLPTLVTASTFRSVSIDVYGRVVGGTNPTTLAGYGITDAKIENGVITLGGNTITPITSLSGYATQSWVQQQGYTTNIGTVTQVNVGSTAYNPSSGVVSLPAYPTSLPASDVYSWAKASSKPSYSWSEIGSRPTALSQFTNDSGFITSSGSCNYANSAGKISGNFVFTDSDLPEGAANLSEAATTHSARIYRNGIIFPYQMDNPNDGGMMRVRGRSESSCILELATWDDSGDGETIQFNYYPTTSQITPTYSVSVPKTNGVLATESYVTSRGYITSSGSCNYANSAGSVAWGNVSGKPSTFTPSSHDHDGRYIRWSNSTADTGAMGWGTLTSSNGYNILSHCASSDGGDMGWCYKGGQIYYQVDGWFYQNEGAYRVLDTSDVRCYRGTMNHTTSNGSHIWYLPMSVDVARRCIFSYFMSNPYNHNASNYSHHAGNGFADTMGVKYVRSENCYGTTITNSWLVTTGGHDAGTMYYCYIEKP